MRKHRGSVKAFIAAALGGPTPFTGRAMADAHHGVDVTDEQFDHLATHLVDILRDVGVDEATIGVIGESVQPLRPHIVGV